MTKHEVDPGTREDRDTPGSPEANKTRIRELIAAVDRHEPPDPALYYTDDYVDHDASPGRALGEGIDGVRKAFALFERGFPDTRHEIHHLIAEDDFVVARISARGTHRAEVLGIPATGARISLEAIAIYRFENGRIAERWCQQGKGIMEQLEEIVSSAGKSRS